MQDQTSNELRERLDLIESMLAEGRRKTESWGWTFVLWGIAYFVAIVWASKGAATSIWGQGHGTLAWPVTMIAAALLTIVIGVQRSRGKPDTLFGRAIFSVWVAAGTSMILLFPALAISGRLDEHAFVAIIAAMLGTANGATAMICKWRMQIVCAVIWWVTAVAACFGSEAQLTVVFLSALFLCQIVFGIYAMQMESRRRQREMAHA